MTESEMISAMSLIRTHGAAAAMEAAMMADRLRARKDKEGHQTWVRIGQAIRELEARPRQSA